MREGLQRLLELLTVDAQLAKSLSRKVTLAWAAEHLRHLIDGERLVYLVVGCAVGDADASWVHSAWADEGSAVSAANQMNASARAAGAVHGKSDLIGLEVGERKSIRQLLKGFDPSVVVGRQGAEWSVKRMVLN